MHAFRVSLHGRLQEPEPGPLLLLQAVPCKTLVGVAASELPVTFESATARLEALPRCHVEPDGSFVRRGRLDQRSWSWEGNLYDRGNALHYVDLWGNCPGAVVKGLLPVFRGDSAGLLVQATQYAAWMSEEEFLSWVQKLWELSE